MSESSVLLEKNDSCWICGSQARLASRKLPLFSTQPGAASVLGQCTVATCFDCRATLHRQCDDRKVALRPRTSAIVRYRAVDIALMMMTLAAALFVATAAGWMSPVGYAFGAASVLLALPLGALNFALARRKEQNRQARWDASPEKKAADSFHGKLEARFAELNKAVQKDGWTLLAPSGEAPSIVQTSLATPEFWSPNAGRPADSSEAKSAAPTTNDQNIAAAT